ncbi:MAG TPA: PAS domain S-box protein [Flavisolibacter sp.]|jgi:PAS domain S-box-containing protein|nr:PAS domain S-box protein [Flavisolibacter sp.]
MKNRPADIVLDSHSPFSNEEALSIILDNLDEVFLLVNKQLHIIQTTESTKESVLKNWGVTITNQTSILELVAEERWPMMMKLYEDVFNGLERETIVELQTINKQAIFETHFRPAKNSKGEIIGAVIIAKDVTEKKKTENILRETEERWRFALEGGNQGVWDWNVQTGEIFFSDSYKRLYGYGANDLKGRIEEWENMIHPDDKNRMSGAIEEHVSAENPYYESTYRVKTKNGDYKWVLGRGMLIRNEDGKPARMIGTHTDITKQVTAEQTYKLLFYSNPLPMWTYDLNTLHFLTVNDEAIHHYGYSKEEFLSMTLLDIRPEDEKEQLLEWVAKRKSLGHLKRTSNHLKKNGEQIIVELSTHRLEDSDTVLVVAQDITERKLLEEELLRNELEKQKAINQATIDSQEQERTEIGKELHDNVNQILTTTKLYLDLALTNKEMKDELISKSNKNIISVINEIRQLSRSLMDPTIGDLGLLDSINDLIENVNLTRRLHVSLVAEQQLELLLSKNNKLTIFRIIQEALNNAIKHARATTVEIFFKLYGDNIMLVIKDDGIGFEASSVKLGAGLKNIQNRVYLVNGTYTIQTSPGNGCKIIINFPIIK